MAKTRALPERYRLVRNIEEGYEVRADCETHPDGHWIEIMSALHIVAPLKVSTFSANPPECVKHLARFSAHPGDDLFSRRPAVDRG